MKRFLWFFWLAVATTIAARAQTATITTAGTIAVATGNVTVSGTVSPTASVAVTITNNAAGTTAASGNATISGTNWTFSFAPPNVGDYLVKATPTGGTAVFSTITIASIAPTVSLTIAGGTASIPSGSTRFLSTTATDDGAITRVEFYLDGVLLGTVTSPASGAIYTLPFTAPGVTGSHQINAKAYDNAGNVTSSNFITIEVTTPIGSGPSVGLNTPGNASFFPVSGTVSVTGAASDSDGTVTKIEVFANGVSVGSTITSTANWTVPWTPATTGVISLVAIATDDRGNTSMSPVVTVNVTDVTSPAVALTISPGTNTLPASATRNLVAAVTPASGRAIVRVELFVDGAKIAERTAAANSTTSTTTGLTTSSYGFRYTAPAASGSSVAVVRATDNTGLARDAQIAFTVVAAVGSPPATTLITPTGGTTTVTPNTTVNLAATATAPGGAISSLQFYANGVPVGSAIVAPPFTGSFVPITPGIYVLDAIATDDRGNTAVSGSATVTAAFAAPTIAFAAPNPNATARATVNVPLTLSAVPVAGAGAQVLLVEFLLDYSASSPGTSIGTKTPPASNTTTGAYSVSWTPAAAQLGTHTLTARVTDTNSQVATSASVNVVIANVVGVPPSVAVSLQPAANANTAQPSSVSTVNFIATATPNGTGVSLSSVELYLNDLSIGTAAREQTTNLYRLAYDFSKFDFTAVTPAINDTTGAVTYPLRLYAIARDSNNNQTVSGTINLAIYSATNTQPPTIALTALSSTVAQGTPIPILPTFSAAGTVTSVQLYANGVASGAAVLNPQIGSILTYNASAAGRFNLYAIATDDTGNTAVSAPIVVNVTAVSAPTTTLTRPSDDATVTNIGAPVFLEGTAVNGDSTQVPTLSFIARGTGTNQTTIAGTRIGTTSTYRAVWTPTVADTYTVSTTSQVGTGGAQGVSATSHRVVVNNVVGIAPTVTITVPNSLTSVSTANFIANAVAAGGGAISSVEFFVNRLSIGQATRDQLTNIWRINASVAGFTPGSYEVVALAHDSAGNTAASPTTNITVTTGTGAKPSVAVIPTPTSIALGQSVVLTATASSVTGTVSSVTYFANNTNLGGRTTAPTPGQAGYLLTWTNAAVGTYNVYAVASDSNGNTNVSDPVVVTVRRFTPLTDNDAFVLQTYVDISNNSAPNLLLASSYSAQLTAGTLTRGQLVETIIDDNGTGFAAPTNLLAAYYLIMGQWPTPTNYSTLITGFRNNLAGAVGSILAEPEYVVKYPEHVAPTVALLNNQASAIPAATFLSRLFQNAGLGAPSALDSVVFGGTATTSTTSYNTVGLNSAIAQLVATALARNASFLNAAHAAALFYQLDKPPTTMSTDDIATKVAAIAAQSGIAAQAGVALNDILYTYRFVTITSSPLSLTVAPRSGAIFRVSAMGAPPISYQWLFNGAPLAGQTGSLLSLTNVDATKAGTYTVLVSTSYGSATSDPATLSLSSTLTKLGNISTRGAVGAGAQTLIAGFVVRAPTGAPANQTRQMLIRVIGPGLSTQGVPTGFLTDPSLVVYNSAGASVVTNDNWGTQTTNAQTNATAVTAIQQATTRTGAFVLGSTTSADAVTLATLAPGNYTVEAKGLANASGVVLIEVYDATPTSAATTPKAINVSTRGNVGIGLNSMIAGFVINGAVSRRVLIRGVGPTLANFGLPAASLLADPQIQLFDSTNASLATNDNWASGDDAATIAAAAISGGAFPLANGSKDAALLVMLAPGAYTVQLTGAGNTTGVGLVEVYDVDP